MLGIGCPDRHALPHFTSLKRRRAATRAPSRERVRSSALSGRWGIGPTRWERGPIHRQCGLGKGSVREVLQTKRQGKSGTIEVKAVLADDEEFLRALVRTALQEVLEAEMTEALGAEKGERASGRQGYRSGYYGRTLITRVGKLELRVPQDRTGRFSTELFERYQRSERALVAALAEMYAAGPFCQSA